MVCSSLLAVVGELVDDLHVVVDDPDVLLRIVGADVDRVRAAEQLVPLLPGLDDLAVAIDHDHAVLPLRVHAELAIRRTLDAELVRLCLPRPSAIRSISLSVPPVPGREAVVASRQKPATGKADARAQLRQQRRLGRRHLRQFAAEQHVDAIRAFGEHAFARAVGPLLVSRQRADVLRPVLDHVVRAGQVLRSQGCPGPRRIRRPAEPVHSRAQICPKSAVRCRRRSPT